MLTLALGAFALLLLLGAALYEGAVRRQAQAALEKAGLDNGELRRRLRDQYAANGALRAEVEALRGRAA